MIDKTKESYSTAKMIEGKHEVLIVWPGWNQKAKGRVVNNGETTVVYMEAEYPGIFGTGWIPKETPPKKGLLVLVRRTSDAIHMARFIGDDWVVYFNNYHGVQSANNPDSATELKEGYDPIVDWQTLPLTPQQVQFIIEASTIK